MTTDWKRFGFWGIIGTLVFGYMHIADELWANWDFGATGVSSSVEASIMGVIPLIIGLWALVWTMKGNAWGHLLGVVLGGFMTYAALSHFIGETAAMTGFQTAVVALLLLFALVTLVACGSTFLSEKPWSGGSTAHA